MAVGNDDDKNTNSTTVDEPIKKTDPFDSLSEEEKKKAVELLNLEKGGQIKTVGQYSVEMDRLRNQIQILESQKENEINQSLQLITELKTLNQEFDLGVDFSQLKVEEIRKQVSAKLIEKLGIDYKPIAVDVPSLTEIQNLATMLRKIWLSSSQNSINNSNQSSSGDKLFDIITE